MEKFEKQVKKLSERLKYRGFDVDYDLEMLIKKYFKEVYELGVSDGYAERIYEETNNK
jgi:hypothetical protein